MSDEQNRSNIKVTDRRLFDHSGQRRLDPDERPGAIPEPEEKQATAPPPPPGPHRGESFESHGAARETADLSDVAAGLASSFSLLLARLAQETEIYLGIAPYPGKTVPEPDIQAARAMIDMLSMLEEKTRGNLDADESRLLSDLLYTYRIEFVRRTTGGPESP